MAYHILEKMVDAARVLYRYKTTPNVAITPTLTLSQSYLVKAMGYFFAVSRKQCVSTI